MAKVTFGFQCKLYRNTGTYEAPTWVEVKAVKDVTLSMEKGEADVTVRGGNGWELMAATLKKASVEFGLLWDPEDPSFIAIQEAYFDNTPLEFAAMSGDITGAGGTVQGLRATMDIFGFTRNEQLTEAVGVNVTVKPTYSANAPEWMTVAAT